MTTIPLLRALILLSLALGLPAMSAAQLPVLQVIDNPVPNTFGFGGAMDVDGDTLVVGAPAVAANGIQRGAVSVYTKVGASWGLQQSLTRNTGLGFGSSVAVSGNTLIAATEYYSPSLGPGPFVYVRSNGVWSQQAELRPSQTNLWAGARVALEGDTAFVTTVDRAVYVFVRSGQTWTEQQMLLPPGPSCCIPRVALQGDLAVVSAPGETVDGNSYRGAVHIYTRAGGFWTRQTTLTATNGRADEFFGFALALSGDTLLVAGDHVYQFTLVAGTWVPAPSLQLPLASILTYRPIGLWFNGDTAIVPLSIDPRAPTDTYVYRRVAGRWVRLHPSIPRGNYLITSDTIFGTGGAGNVERVTVYSVPPVSFTGPPGPPDQFRASASGHAVTMTWEPPETGGPPTGYHLVGRVTPGGPVLANILLGDTTAFTITAPSGQFYLTLTASNADGTGPESNDVGVNLPAPPQPISAPTNLTANVTGTTVSFSWGPPTWGVPTGYIVWAGLTPSVSPPLVTVPVGTATTFVATGVPPGKYYVFVQARDAFSVSSASNVVTVTVAGQPPPGTPTLNAPVVSGSTVSLSWSAGSGGTPTGYTLAASVSPGGAPIVTVPLTGTSASFASVPSGTYYLRLTATNAGGTSPPSAVVTLVVP